MITHDETTVTRAVWVAITKKAGHPAPNVGWSWTRKALQDRFTADHEMSMEQAGYQAVRASLTWKRTR